MEMTWRTASASVMLVLAVGVPAAFADDPPQAVGDRAPLWHLSVRALKPVTSTDPQHTGVSVGLARTGTYRAAVHFQPAERGGLGMVHGALGLRVFDRATWQLSMDLEHTQVRANRRLFVGTGWQLDGHDRQQVSLLTGAVQWHEKRVWGLIRGIEAGVGRMQVWRLVSARAGSDLLNSSPDPILESGAPVGVLGIFAERSLGWGFSAEARVRVIGAGHSPGGEVPFAHVAAHWDLTRPVFGSAGSRRMEFGLSGSHASSPRAVSYYQNGLGLALRVVF
jgi:hypothetical protein